MINSMRVMLYVNDVEKISKFWQDKFKAQVLETNILPDNSKNIVLQINDQIQFALFNREFIKKYSPEVLGPVPSLMLFVDDFDEMTKRLNPKGTIQEMNGMKTINFADPEGNYFVIAEKD